jgi:hypothetical protein
MTYARITVLWQFSIQICMLPSFLGDTTPIVCWHCLKCAHQVRFNGTLGYLIITFFSTHFQVVIWSIESEWTLFQKSIVGFGFSIFFDNIDVKHVSTLQCAFIEVKLIEVGRVKCLEFCFFKCSDPLTLGDHIFGVSLKDNRSIQRSPTIYLQTPKPNDPNWDEKLIFNWVLKCTKTGVLNLAGCIMALQCAL